MHDQRRGTRKTLSEEQQTEVNQRIIEFKAIYAEVFAARDAHSVSRSVLPKQERVLVQNPECFSVWSHRRRVYEALWDEEARALSRNDREEQEEQKAPAAVPAEVAAKATAVGMPPVKFMDVVTELKLNTKIVTQDYKCYAAWTHRRWILNHMSDPLRLKVLSEEYAKIEELLRADERNFHAWGYRRHVVRQLEALGAFGPEKDLAFAEAKILQTLSNYSAWHNRAYVMARMVDEAVAAAAAQSSEAAGDADSPVAARLQRLEELLRHDVGLAVRAFYADSRDQSTWMYVPALLQHLRRLTGPDVRGAAAGVVDWVSVKADLVGQLTDAAFELAEDDVGNDDAHLKWPLWLVALLASEGLLDLATRPLRIRSDATQPLLTKPREAWETLAVVDPLRRGCYLDKARAAVAAAS